VTSERRAGPSAGFLDPFTLAAVEVARGPGSVAYGSDAFGGIINARSRFPEPGAGPSLRFAVDQGAGAVDERAAGLEASGDLWGGAWLAQLRARSAGDSEAPGGERILASAYSDRGGALRYAVDTPAGRLRAAVTLDESRDTGNPAADSAITRSIYPQESSRRFNLGLASGPVAGWDSLDLGLFLGTYRLVLDRERVPAATVTRQIDRSDVDANDGSVRVVGSRAALGGRLQVGAEVVSRFGLQAITDRDLFNLAGDQTARQTTVSIDEARRVDSGLFLIWDRPLLASTLLSVGLRGDRVESRNQGGFFGDRSTSHDALSGYLAVTAGLTPRLTASLQASRGFRDPLLSDRYFRGPSGRGFVTGNPDLEPETSRQLDGSLRWALGDGAGGNGGGSLALFGYLYRIDDLIERYRPVADFLFRNRGEAEIRGVELELQRPLGAGFQMELAATLARGEVLDDGTPLADVPPGAAFLTLRWAGERLFVFGRGGAVRRDERAGTAEVVRPGHTTLDLGTGWHFTQGLELRLVGKNLTGRRYRESADETAALASGRSVTIGLVGRY
jgi:iron complex outermembrane receptor protein